jgi:hypothetical protein
MQMNGAPTTRRISRTMSGPDAAFPRTAEYGSAIHQNRRGYGRGYGACLLALAVAVAGFSIAVTACTGVPL